MYAYLKRLGYVVVRARALQPAAARPPKPVPRSIAQILQAPFLAARAWLLRVLASARQLRFGQLSASLRLAVTRTLQAHEGTLLSLVSGRRWASYGTSDEPARVAPRWRDGVGRKRVTGGLADTGHSFVPLAAGDIFGRLQVIPTGHDLGLPRGLVERVPSKLTPLHPVEAHPELPSLETSPYQPFYHVYKPATKFKKSAPGPPDFRLVVVK